jgi:hypothetical protein
LHREIKAMGFVGAYSTLTEYLRLIRPTAPRQFERRFETPAGQQTQEDFAEFQVAFTSEPGITRKVWLFSMVLGHSRWLWGRFCPNQTVETVIRCHIAAFNAMDGACAQVLCDRMKTAVISEDAAEVVTYNATLVALLGHYGSPSGLFSPILSARKQRSGGRLPGKAPRFSDTPRGCGGENLARHLSVLAILGRPLPVAASHISRAATRCGRM